MRANADSATDLDDTRTPAKPRGSGRPAAVTALARSLAGRSRVVADAACGRRRHRARQRFPHVIGLVERRRAEDATSSPGRCAARCTTFVDYRVGDGAATGRASGAMSMSDRARAEMTRAAPVIPKLSQSAIAAHMMLPR